MKTTVIDDVIIGLVASLDAALTYPVFDGPPSRRADRSASHYLIIGASDAQDDESESAVMSAEWYGIGQVARKESLDIRCIAVGKAPEGNIATARQLALSTIQDVTANLPRNPTPESYACQVSEISEVRSKNVPGGSIVTVGFTISATARLV